MMDRLAFQRADESPDELFYRRPRFVTHIDAGAIGAVTQLYRELFMPGSRLLDLMSSCVSHLPADVPYARVVGLGMNAAELAGNPQLDERIVADLNADPKLPFDNESFDGAAICVSIQYLTRPVAVLADLARVLQAGSPLIVTFSNRCFPTKAVAAWLAGDPRGHLALVADYLRLTGGYGAIESLDRSPQRGDPLYAVVAHTSSAPR